MIDSEEIHTVLIHTMDIVNNRLRLQLSIGGLVFDARDIDLSHSVAKIRKEVQLLEFHLRAAKEKLDWIEKVYSDADEKLVQEVNEDG